MARMIPDINPELIANAGEKEMYKRLRDELPQSWVVRYHFPACWMEGTHLRECECDFIVLAPGKGLLLLEVKGSHGYHAENGQWYRLTPDNSREPTRNPFEQATATKHKLVERIAKKVFSRPKHEFPGIFGHVVIYPFGRSLGDLPSTAEPALLLGYSDMPNLPAKLAQAFDAWGNAKRGRQFTADCMTRVERFLGEHSDLVPVLAVDVDQDEQQIRDLTLRQFTALRGILAHPRVHVTGTAGSGKTLLALWSAKSFAQKNQKTLLLCFNRVLAAWLKHKHGGSGAFEIRSFFAMCKEVVEKAGITFSIPKSENKRDEFWCNDAPRLLCDALESQSSLLGGYDAILVDEAQDFHADWWFPLQLLLRDPDQGRLVVFSDPEQAGVYGRGNSYPAGLLSFELFENCRNTKQIASYCGEIIKRQICPFRSSPIGVPPTICEPHQTPMTRGKAVKDIVTSLFKEGFSADRIAVLSPWSLSNLDACAKNFSIQGLPLSGDDSTVSTWHSAKAIWFSTIKAFKGLEADVVIVTDVPTTNSPGFNLSELYIAASRAKHRLYFVPMSKDAADELRSLALSQSQQEDAMKAATQNDGEQLRVW